MTDKVLNLEGLRKLLDGATPGPWRASIGMFGPKALAAERPSLMLAEVRPDNPHRPGQRDSIYAERHADAELVRATLNALPALLDELATLRDARESVGGITEERLAAALAKPGVLVSTTQSHNGSTTLLADETARNLLAALGAESVPAWPSREDFRAMSSAEVNAFFESRGIEHRVAAFDAPGRGAESVPGEGRKAVLREMVTLAGTPPGQATAADYDRAIAALNAYLDPALPGDRDVQIERIAASDVPGESVPFHVHEGEWCAACVEHGAGLRVEAESVGGLEAAWEAAVAAEYEYHRAKLVRAEREGDEGLIRARRAALDTLTEVRNRAALALGSEPK